MLKLDLGPGARRTAHELVRDTLRQAILRGEIAGGTRLVQTEVAQQLGVSTTPVREALRDLATEGLIHLDAHRGAIVKRLTYDELREIHHLCKLLEPDAMLQAAEHVTPGQLERAEELATAMDREDDPGRWADYNRQFHAVLVGSAPSPRLLAILGGLRDSAAPYVGLGLQRVEGQTDEAGSQHRQLVEAMRQGDGKRAASIAADHLDLTMRVLDAARDVFEGAAAPAG